MGKIIILATLLSLPFFSFAQNAEEDAIKKLMRQETEVFFARKADAWKAIRLQQENTSNTYVSSNSYTNMMGWEKLRATVENNFKSNSKPIPVEVKQDNFTIRTGGDLAWVEYDQTLTVPGVDPKSTDVSREYRSLVKDNGSWKIASQISLYPETFASTAEATERSLRIIGYKLLDAKKVDDAVQVFQLNAKLNPGSWMVYDCLGEAYALAGNKNAAIENYEQSTKINPKNEEGMAALKKLK
jgi:tetratricopeptide (TPR) repeat protein